MSKTSLSFEEFRSLLPLICDKRTINKSEKWTHDNPLYAHCAVVSLLAQDLYGGSLLRASLVPYPEFAEMSSHYWNKLPDGSEMDFTAPQFHGRRPQLVGEPRTRQHMLFDPNTGEPREIMKRYKLLALRLAKIRSKENRLFDDPIYLTCFSNALDSQCQKMKFGCVITHEGGIVYQGANQPIAELSSLCEQSCIRFSIPSRTESMLGACGHAEERGLWKLVEKKIPLEECELYVAGFFPDGLPWLKTEKEGTCLRCAVQMHYAHLKAVYIPIIDHWESMTTKEVIETARLYAMKQKTI